MQISPKLKKTPLEGDKTYLKFHIFKMVSTNNTRVAWYVVIKGMSSGKPPGFFTEIAC